MAIGTDPSTVTTPSGWGDTTKRNPTYVTGDATKDPSCHRNDRPIGGSAYRDERHSKRQLAG
jgi:hypothetical protein